MIFCFGPWKCEYKKDNILVFTITYLSNNFHCNGLNMTFNFDKISLKIEIEGLNCKDFETFEARSINFEELVTSYNPLQQARKVNRDQNELEFLRSISHSMKNQADILKLMDTNVPSDELPDSYLDMLKDVDEDEK